MLFMLLVLYGSNIVVDFCFKKYMQGNINCKFVITWATVGAWGSIYDLSHNTLSPPMSIIAVNCFLISHSLDRKREREREKNPSLILSTHKAGKFLEIERRGCLNICRKILCGSSGNVFCWQQETHVLFSGFAVDYVCVTDLGLLWLLMPSWGNSDISWQPWQYW